MDCQPLKIVTQYCLKIMLFISLHLEEDTLKDTKQDISYQNSFILTSFIRKKKTLISSKSGQVIILHTYLQSLYQPQLLRSMSIIFEL